MQGICGLFKEGVDYTLLTQKKFLNSKYQAPEQTTVSIPITLL